MTSPPFLRTTLVLFFLNYKTLFTVKITVASLYSYYIIRSDLIYFCSIICIIVLYQFTYPDITNICIIGLSYSTTCGQVSTSNAFVHAHKRHPNAFDCDKLRMYTGNHGRMFQTRLYCIYSRLNAYTRS